MRWIALLFAFQVVAKDLKLLVLIIGADNPPYYKAMEEVQRSYIHYDVAHVEAYFLKYDPNLDEPYKIGGDTITFRGTDSIIPGVADKTILAMEALLPRLHEFDFVLRTNLSSAYVFPRLFPVLETLPRDRCYFACQNSIINQDGSFYAPFGSGAGLVLSTDLVQMLVANKDTLLGHELVDDVLFGWVMLYAQVPLIQAMRMDIPDLKTWRAWQNRLPAEIYHFRLKQTEEAKRATDEILIHKALARKFYPQMFR